jgi:cytochrome c oxidase subunit II
VSTPLLPDALDWLYRLVLFLPAQASAQARSIDTLQYFEITVMTGIAFVLAAAAGFFAWRYRRRPGVTRAPVHLARSLELSVYGGLLLFFIGLWVVGFRQYRAMETAPGDALEIYVTAKQWVWKFSYPEGVASAGVLALPADRPIRLLLTSRDVIHSFYVPAFRLKRDAVPGTYTSIAFRPTLVGRYPILCAEMCGVGHARMSGEVVVLPADRFEAWLHDRPDQPAVGASGSLVDRGRRAAVEHGCFACHTVNGAEYLGPTWKGLYGSRVALQDGSEVLADESYVTRSMMDPLAQIVKGFAPVMPSFRGQIDPADTAAIIAFIKSLATAPSAPGEASRER